MPSKRVKSLLDNAGVSYEMMEHDTAFTSLEVAAATHVKARELAKAVMLKSSGHTVMAVIPATCKINFDLAESFLKSQDVSLAAEEEFSPLFPDCERGAMPPFGELYGVDVIADEKLAKDREIVFNAGTHHEIMRMSFEDWKNLVKPRMGSFTSHI